VDWTLALVAVMAFAAGAAIGVFVSSRRRGRMVRIRDGIAEFASGNLSHRIILPGDDDAGRMAIGLNALADAVQQEREVSGARDEARRTLLANISHDLRTPIASVAGYVDALQRGLGDDPDRYLAIIAAKTEELIGLTDDLFYEARLDAGDLELKRGALDLAEAVRRSALGFEPQLAGRGVRVEVAIPEHACTVEADASAVARILGNLVSNALRHGEGMTFLSIALAEEEDGYAVRLTNDGAELPADMERLFERGVAGVGGGAGLGLSIARELADRMGARVWAERVGTGSVTFALSFPKAVAGA
jgi:signal transduction histidine kinase